MVENKIGTMIENKKGTMIENKKGTIIDKMLHRKLNIDDKHWIKNR